MELFVTVAQVVLPIFAAIVLGILAKKYAWVNEDNVQGFQKFVMKIGLPCVVFNSCLTAKIGAESLTSMGLILPALLLATAWAFRVRRNHYPYHNLPLLFCAQESGMLGIPLYMILFGADQAYRMGMLDLTQSLIAIPVIAILSTDAGKNPTTGAIVKKVFSSPLLIMSFLGLTLNISGIGEWMDNMGIGSILTETTTFLSQPVSALMIFSVGYNFSLCAGSRGVIVKLSVIHFAYYAVVCLAVQAALFLVADVDKLTRLAVFLYCMLPGSYLTPSLGRNEEQYQIMSGVCSILTIVCLAIICIMAVVMA